MHGHPEQDIETFLPLQAAPAHPETTSGTHSLSTCAALPCPPNHRPSGSRTCNSRPCSPPPAGHRTCATLHSWPCPGCSACGSSKQLARTSPTLAKGTVTECRAYAAKAARWSWSRCRLRSDEPSTGLSAAACVGRSCSTAAVPGDAEHCRWERVDGQPAAADGASLRARCRPPAATTPSTRAWSHGSAIISTRSTTAWLKHPDAGQATHRFFCAPSGELPAGALQQRRLLHRMGRRHGLVP